VQGLPWRCALICAQLSRSPCTGPALLVWAGTAASRLACSRTAVCQLLQPPDCPHVAWPALCSHNPPLLCVAGGPRLMVWMW